MAERKAYLVRAVLALTLCIAGVARSQAPQVFTGTLTHNRLGVKQLVRLTLVTALRPGPEGAAQPVPVYGAVLSLYWGTFATPETVSLYYDHVIRNPQTGEFILAKPETTESAQRLPVVRFRFDEGGGIRGDFTSPVAGFIGPIELTPGWEPRPLSEPVLTPLAGVYRGDCAAFGDARLAALELVPSRIDHSEARPAEALQAGINYVGGATCDFNPSDRSDPNRLMGCGLFKTGLYDVYRGKLTLLYQDRTWSCDRLGADQLTCSNAWLNRCTLTRDPSIPVFEPRRSPVHEFQAPIDTARADDAATQPCGAWEGAYQGKLLHRDGREQFVAFRLTTLLLQGPEPPVRCAIIGSADLVFGDQASGAERLTAVFPQTDIIPGRNEQVLFPDLESDVLLYLVQREAGVIEGQWLSKRFGVVGTFRASTSELPVLDGPAVPVLAGQFTRVGAPGDALEINVIPGGIGMASINPYANFKTTGIRYDVTNVPFEATSYDFYTNYVVVQMPGIFFRGRVSKQSLDVTVVGGKTLGFSNPGALKLSFRR